jgi:hypothetical protein
LHDSSLERPLAWIAKIVGDLLPIFALLTFSERLWELGPVTLKLFANLHQVRRPVIAELHACGGDLLMIYVICRNAAAPTRCLRWLGN